MVDAVTAYIARRLVERDKALATAEPRGGAATRAPIRQTAARAEPAPPPAPRPRHERPRGAPRHWASAGLRFALEFLGSVALFALLWAAAYGLWVSYGRALWATYLGPPPV
jgi:hypothetical protein